MTKSTPDVSTCSVFKSSPEAFISPLFFKNSFTLGGGGGNAPSHNLACAWNFTYPAGTIRWISVEMKFRTTSRRYFNYILTLF